MTDPETEHETGDSWVIETHDLTKRFKSTVAVDGLNLAIHRGEIFGLLGPDGAGKTTTIRMLCTIMNPTAGSARVIGWDTVQGREEIKRRIGYMAQQFALYGDLTVLENLILFADIFQGTPRGAPFRGNAKETGPGLRADPRATSHLFGRTDDRRGPALPP
jgi:ABC-type multidrug transport system ATPase subunit